MPALEQRYARRRILTQVSRLDSTSCPDLTPCLQNWKSQFKPYYTTELIGKRARVLMKQLPVAWRPPTQQAKGG